LSCLTYYNTISVGASTALMGVLGAYCVDLIFKWKKTDPSVRRATLYPTLLMVGFILLFSFFGSTFIDGAGHLGGFICGVLLGGVYFVGELDNGRIRKLMAISSSILLATYFICGFVLFFTVIPV